MALGLRSRNHTPLGVAIGLQWRWAALVDLALCTHLHIHPWSANHRLLCPQGCRDRLISTFAAPSVPFRSHVSRPLCPQESSSLSSLFPRVLTVWCSPRGPVPQEASEPSVSPGVGLGMSLWTEPHQTTWVWGSLLRTPQLVRGRGCTGDMKASEESIWSQLKGALLRLLLLPQSPLIIALWGGAPTCSVTRNPLAVRLLASHPRPTG